MVEFHFTSLKDLHHFLYWFFPFCYLYNVLGRHRNNFCQNNNLAFSPPSVLFLKIFLTDCLHSKISVVGVVLKKKLHRNNWNERVVLKIVFKWGQEVISCWMRFNILIISARQRRIGIHNLVLHSNERSTHKKMIGWFSIFAYKICAQNFIDNI